MSTGTESDPLARGRRTLGRYVNHDDPLVRFVSLWLVCAALFVAAWYVGYYLLPRGLLRSANAASALPEYAGSVQAEYLTLFAWNLGVAVATRGVVVWHQRSGPRWKEEFERVRSPRDWTLTRREAVVLLGGLALLAAANYREAVMIAEAVGGQ